MSATTAGSIGSGSSQSPAGSAAEAARNGSNACFAQWEQLGQPTDGPQLELFGRLFRGGHRPDELATPPNRPRGAVIAPGVSPLEGLEVEFVVTPADGSGSLSHAASRSGKPWSALTRE